MPIQLISTRQAADRLGLSTAELHELRCRDDGLCIVQKGFLVGYRLEDIRAFEQREVLAILERVLAAERPLPLIRAIYKAVMSAPSSRSDPSLTVQISKQDGAVTLPLTPSLNSPCLSAAKAQALAASASLSKLKPTASVLPTAPSSSSTLTWYLIHTKPRQEALALTNLSRQGFECYLPMLKVQKVRQGKAALVAEPIFPRYLFIRLDASGSGQSWSPIRSTLGVSQLVKFGGQPAKVDAQLIAHIRSREQGIPAQAMFAAGARVVVADGPFAGLEAIYQTSDAQSRSMILLEILSKPVSLRIDVTSLRKAV